MTLGQEGGNFKEAAIGHLWYEEECEIIEKTFCHTKNYLASIILCVFVYGFVVLISSTLGACYLQLMLGSNVRTRHYGCNLRHY